MRLKNATNCQIHGTREIIVDNKNNCQGEVSQGTMKTPRSSILRNSSL